MRIFYDTPRNSVRLCWLSFLAITVIIVNYKYKLTLSSHGRRGFLTSPMQSVQVISKSTIILKNPQSKQNPHPNLL